MNKQLEDLWKQAEANRGVEIDIGDIVVCDVCSDDYTESDDKGGFIFGSYAYCPKCAAEHEPLIEREGEAHYIRARCPEGKSFADFVREYRPSNTISISGGALPELGDWLESE